MSTRKIKRRLQASLKEVTGCGDGVTFIVTGWRTTKAGTHESYELELTACRGAVRALLGEFRKMHHRDRAYIASQQRRIDREIGELTTEQA